MLFLSSLSGILTSITLITRLRFLITRNQQKNDENTLILKHLSYVTSASNTRLTFNSGVLLPLKNLITRIHFMITRKSRGGCWYSDVYPYLYVGLRRMLSDIIVILSFQNVITRTTIFDYASVEEGSPC